MRTRALRQAGTGGLHWPPSWPFSFITTFSWGAALVLLGVAAAAILRVRSSKYLVALILVAVGGAAFLAIPRKQFYLVFAVGFSLPYHAQVILMQRDVTLSLTGTFLLTLMLALACLAAGKYRRKGLVLAPTVSLPALLFMLAGFLSLLYTSDKTDTFIALAQNLEMLLLFWILVNSIGDEKFLVNFLRGLYVGFALQCCIFVIQNLTGFSFEVVGNAEYVGVTDLTGGRVVSHHGTFGGTPAQAALYFSVFTLFLIGAFLCRKRLRLSLNPVLGMIVGAACLFLAAKRAPIGGFVIGLSLMGLLVGRYSAPSLKRLFRVSAFMAVPLLALLPVLLLRSKADHEAAYEERMSLNMVAWNMHREHPIIGAGLGTYDGVKRYYVPEDWKGWLYKVHNRYLMILAESGLVGLSAFLSLHLMVLITAFRGIRAVDPAYRPLQIALVCGVAAVLWEMLWDIFDLRTQGYILWFLVSLSVILPRVLPEGCNRGPHAH